MKRGHNELVGVQVTFSKVMPRYRLTHFYQWRGNGKAKTHGTMRGYDMCRLVSADKILRSLRDTYAPAILSIWQQATPGCIKEYLQFDVGCTPLEMKFEGVWDHFAEW